MNTKELMLLVVAAVTPKPENLVESVFDVIDEVQSAEYLRGCDAAWRECEKLLVAEYHKGFEAGYKNGYVDGMDGTQPIDWTNANKAAGH